jgi:hypothetical protein
MKHFEWKKFYDVGNHLNNHSKEESYQRSAIGRYYYACYGPVKNYYEESFRKNLSTKDEPHRTLIDILKNSPFVEEQELGGKLEELRGNRNYADYTSKKLNRTLTSQSKKCAEEIFLMLKKLYANPLRLMKK